MKTQRGVVLGRFSPLHKGHEALIQAMIDRHGLAHSFVLIGSSQAERNAKTPYSYEARKEMIQLRFPGVPIAPLPDVAKTEAEFETTNERWLAQIALLEASLGASFTFYGGSEIDLKYLSERFPVLVLYPRTTIPVSATQARKALRENDHEVLDTVLDARIQPLAKMIDT